MIVPLLDLLVSRVCLCSRGIWKHRVMRNCAAWQASHSQGTCLFPPPVTAHFHQETLAAGLSTACPRHPGPEQGWYVTV